MKKICASWNCIRTALAKIHLVDKVLILFMILLLFESACNLFINHTVTGEASNIDVIVRTSTAAIFGYFLSTNFIRHSSQGTSRSGGKGASVTLAEGGIGAQNRIGFSTPGSSADGSMLESGTESRPDGATDIAVASRLQIITASAIGLFCLIVLILLRNVSWASANITSSASSTATVAQFRDIVSGCIGFLIGCPSTGATNSK